MYKWRLTEGGKDKFVRDNLYKLIQVKCTFPVSFNRVKLNLKSLKKLIQGNVLKSIIIYSNMVQGKRLEGLSLKSERFY